MSILLNNSSINPNKIAGTYTMNTRTFFFPSLLLIVSLLGPQHTIAAPPSTTEEVKIGLLLPEGSKTVEKDIPTLIDKLKPQCQSSFSVVDTWHYQDCTEAVKRANDAATQVKVLFTEGCYSQVNEALKLTPVLPYPVSSYTTPAELEDHLRKYCGVTRESMVRVIKVPFALLRQEIPVEDKEVEDKTKVVGRLARNDSVIEQPKDSSDRYEDDSCKKRILVKGQEQLVWYDWSQTRDWLCVRVKSAADSSLQNKTGWIHRLLAKVTTEPATTGSEVRPPDDKPLTFNAQIFPPFSFEGPQGEVKGPFTEIINLVCHKAGLTCVVKFSNNWNDAVKAVEEGKDDGLISIQNVPERKLELSQPLIESEYGFFVRENDSWKFNGDKNTLRGKKIGAYGTSSATWKSLLSLTTGLAVQTDLSDRTETVLDKLQKGQIDIAYSNKDVGESFKRRNNLAITYAGRDKPIIYYIGVRKGSNPKFLELLKSKELAVQIRKIISNSNLEPSKDLR
jgi:polar amino acid transport system substrate-binding protein